MTSVLSYVNDYFSIVLTDNRINYGKNQEGGYEDGFKKLINLPEMGWAAGAGLHDYLVKIKDELAMSDINKTGDIVNIFKSVIESSKKENPNHSDEIDSCVVVASWLASDGSNINFRIGILSNEHFGDRIEILDNGDINIVYPGDYLNDLDKVVNLKSKFDLDIGEKDLSYVLSSMLNIFEYISSISKQVSTTCDIGLQTFLEDGIYKITFSGEVKELISELKDGTISNRFKEVSSIKFKLH